MELFHAALHKLGIAEALPVERHVGEGSFLLLHLEQARLDGVLDDELDGGDRASLTKAVYAVDGLVLDGGIPARMSATEGT